MSEQSEALRLAYWLERDGATCQQHIDAAAELRRLHAENARMASELSRPMSSEATVILHDNRRLRNINRQLLEALERLVAERKAGLASPAAWDQARAAIAAARSSDETSR